MRVSDENVAHFSVADRGHQTIEMGVDVWARIDHGQLSIANQIRTGAAEREPIRVSGHHSFQRWRDELGDAVFRREVEVEQRRAHGASVTLDMCGAPAVSLNRKVTPPRYRVRCRRQVAVRRAWCHLVQVEMCSQVS